LLAVAVRFGENQRPDLWAAHLECVASLDLPVRPQLYLSGQSDMNAMTVGSGKPIIVVNSGLVKSVGQEDLTAVLAHESGHVLSDHVHYITVLAILQRLILTGMSPIGFLPLRAVVLVLLEWQRCAELSSDRAATLVTGDPRVTCRVLMNIAGGGASGLDLDAFMQQAADYADTEDLLARPGRFLTEITRSHPFAVRRVGELTRWVDSGEFQRIREGHYLHRGEEPPVTDHVRAAAEHYRQRFTEIIDRVAGGAQKLFNQFTSWFRNDGPDDEGDGFL
jgi:Zn-dependent protease with chaperone function